MSTATRRTEKAASDGVSQRRRRGEIEHEEIKVVLAHYLPADNEFTGQEQKAGDEVTVKRHVARHLISAGYAAVDPENAAEVTAALQLGPGENTDGKPEE